MLNVGIYIKGSRKKLLSVVITILLFAVQKGVKGGFQTKSKFKKK